MKRKKKKGRGCEGTGKADWSREVHVTSSGRAWAGEEHAWVGPL